MRLSAIVITLNEENNIADCLTALKFADEIILVDSHSADRTCEIARRFTPNVLLRKFDDFSSQKNFALSLAKGEWILSVDADERVSVALASEIQRTISSETADVAYRVLRHTRLFNKEFRYSGLQNDKPVRLFRRGRGVFKNPVHEELRVDGKTGLLREPLRHISFQTLEDYWKKLQLYTAIAQPSEEKTIGMAHVLGRPIYRFLDIYFLKQGFRDGMEGFIYSVLSSYHEFVRWAKRWEKGVLAGE